MVFMQGKGEYGSFTLCYVVLFYDMLCYVMLCYILPCNVKLLFLYSFIFTPSSVILCYVMLFYVM